MSASTVPRLAASLLDPAVLARIDDLELVARAVVDGFLSGLHRSPRLGVSTDFAEHRTYQPGDDIRRVDWRIYARTDRLHVREFEAETNTEVMFAVDTSGSMRFGSGSHSKLDYARILVACLAHLSARQRDRVGLVLFGGDVQQVIPPSLKHVPLILQHLARATAEGAGRLREPLRAAAATSRRRRIWVVVSDFYSPPDELAEAVGALLAHGGEVIAMHVLDPAELALPYAEAATFVDAETGEELPLSAPDVRERYREEIERHVGEVKRALRGRGIDTALFTTDQPLGDALHRYLAERERLGRIR
ncbi:MAG TPA: DUF58 domain-containing protein [Gemmatimonadales bacterium]|nr:DUF58 domain-containing protein [Gemmatimonadales bacterium]